MEEFPRKSQVKGEVRNVRPQRVLCFQKSLENKNINQEAEDCTVDCPSTAQYMLIYALYINQPLYTTILNFLN